MDVPCAFQGRISNAKGLWVVSYDEEKDKSDPVWIDISHSQEKFRPHLEDESQATSDPLRTTFDLLDWSRPPSFSHLSVSMIPIVHHGGVHAEEFHALIDGHFKREGEYLECSRQDSISLVKWLSDKLPQGESSGEQPSVSGCMPNGLKDRIEWMVQSGFTVDSSSYLTSLVWKGLGKWCDRAQKKPEIQIPSSTMVFARPDFDSTLKEGEIHLAFSQGSPAGELPCLFDQDVLVGRYPMHRPSDVQKIRAVFRPALSHVKDLAVFSSEGTRPHADVMSNGDYDGDRFWVCWEPRLVQSFTNTAPLLCEARQILAYAPTKDDSVTCSQATMQHSPVTTWWPRRVIRCWACVLRIRKAIATDSTLISDPKIDVLADLRDHLVDATKQGLDFVINDWYAFLRHHGYPPRTSLAEPAYKTDDILSRSSYEHILDQIKFDMLKPKFQQFRTLARTAFDLPFRQLDVLRAPYVSWLSAEEDMDMQRALQDLNRSLTDFVRSWLEGRRGMGTACYAEDITSALARYRRIEPPGDSPSRVKEWVRKAGPSAPSLWALIKASTLYALVADSHVKAGKSKVSEHFLFSMAATELCFLTAFSGVKSAIAVTPPVLERMKFKSGPYR